jgi:hypothetical protein
MCVGTDRAKPARTRAHWRRRTVGEGAIYRRLLTHSGQSAGRRANGPVTTRSYNRPNVVTCLYTRRVKSPRPRTGQCLDCGTVITDCGIGRRKLRCESCRQARYGARPSTYVRRTGANASVGSNAGVRIWRSQLGRARIAVRCLRRRPITSPSCRSRRDGSPADQHAFAA